MDTATFKARLRKHDAPPAEPAEIERFVTYPDLTQHGIPKYSRVHLRRLMARGLFPQACYLSPNRVAWRISELNAWKSSRQPMGGDAA
jgi:predicted DNA-binding transcriptional regulator AlpA